MDWKLECSGCRTVVTADGLPTVCPDCGSPWLVRYDRAIPPGAEQALSGRERSMWRYREFLPLRGADEPVTLGEGGTPLLRAHRLAERLGMREVWIKDEATNPTGSFKARGLAAAVTRASLAGAHRFVLP